MRTLSRFARELLIPHDTEPALSDMAGHVRQILGLRGSAVSLGRRGALIVATAASGQLGTLERVQQDHQCGPSVTAFQEQRVVSVEDLVPHRMRWPHYCGVAESIGVSSVAAVPMHLHGTRVGALSLYGDGHRRWPEDDVAVAVVMADMATVYLINASVLQHHQELNAQLQHALVARITIEQAKGALANKHQISVEAALDRLRRHARAHREPLRGVAEAVIDGKLTL